MHRSFDHPKELTGLGRTGDQYTILKDHKFLSDINDHLLSIINTHNKQKPNYPFLPAFQASLPKMISKANTRWILKASFLLYFHFCIVFNQQNLKQGSQNVEGQMPTEEATQSSSSLFSITYTKIVYDREGDFTCRRIAD